TSPRAGAADGDDHLRRGRDQFRRVFHVLVCVTGAPTIFDADIGIIGPTQLLKPLLERRDVKARLRIVRDAVHQHADAPHPLALLRARRTRPHCRRAAEQRDKFPALHSITPSARCESTAGTSRLSALAVVRLTTISYLTGACTGSSLGFAPRRMRSA